MQEGLPLKPTRTMTFTTRVGHWMSVDVSHDGQTLVFDLLGDIYTMPIAGGKATALTRGMGFDAQPRFSPDGKKVVFVSDRDGGYNLYVMSVDKKDTVQLTTGKTNRYYSPTFTPDGKYVIVTRGTRLFIYDIEGGTGEELVRPEARRRRAARRVVAAVARADALRQMGAAFGGDPRYVWFAQRRGTFMYNTPLQDYTLAVYDRESGQTTMRESRWGSAFRPVLSPDGKWLVYGTRYVDETRLRIRDLKTGEEKWLVYPVQRDDQESAASLDVFPGMAFTPDSKFVITTWDGKLWKVPVPTGKPVEIPFEADVVQPMGPAVRFDYSIPDSSTFVIKQIRDATPSPDGRKLAFVALDRLYVMDYPERHAASPDERERSASSSRRGVPTDSGSCTRRGTARTAATCTRRAPTARVSRRSSRPSRRIGSTRRSRRTASRIVAVRGPARAFNRALAQGTPGGAEDVVWFPASGGDATFIAPRRRNGSTAVLDARHVAHLRLQRRRAVCSRCAGTAPTCARCFASPRVADAAAVAVAAASRGVLDLARRIAGARAVVVDRSLLDVDSVARRTGAADHALARHRHSRITKLTDIGGQFPAWSADGKHVHWSIGNAHVVYDLAACACVRRLGASRDAHGAVVAGDSAVPAAVAVVAAAPTARSIIRSETRIRITAERDMPKSRVGAARRARRSR